jgi:phosphotransferase system IIB component
VTAESRDSAATTDREMAARIIGLVGGPGNVVRVTHCYSRLRFALLDDAGADDARLFDAVLEGIGI